MEVPQQLRDAAFELEYAISLCAVPDPDPEILRRAIHRYVYVILAHALVNSEWSGAFLTKVGGLADLDLKASA